MTEPESEYVKADEAEREFRQNVADIDFDAVDVAVLAIVEDGELSMHTIGDPELIIAALKLMLAGVQERYSLTKN